MGCSLPGSSVHEISQARILDWFAISFSKDLPNPGIKPASSVSPALPVDSLPTEPPGKPLFVKRILTNLCEKYKLLVLFGFFVINSKLLGNPRTEDWTGGPQSMGLQKSWTLLNKETTATTQDFMLVTSRLVRTRAAKGATAAVKDSFILIYLQEAPLPATFAGQNPTSLSFL